MDEQPAVLPFSSPLSTPLVPRSVIQDGHEFYVYVSIALFAVHDQHQSVRHRLWDMFARMAWKTPLSALVAPGAYLGPLTTDNEELRPILDACIVYLGLQRQAQREFQSVSQTLKDYVARQMDQPLPAPLYVMCPLVAKVYHLGVVLYDAGSPPADTLATRGEPSSRLLGEEALWRPVYTWHPPEDTLPPLRYLHLLQRGDTLQMLVNRKTDDDDLRVLVPTRVVGTLPAALKTHYLFEAASSRAIEARAVYKLDVFDCKQRRHLKVGSFVAPGMAEQGSRRLQTLHYMRLDMSISKKSDYVFLIEGCQDAAVPIHIYACSSSPTQGVRCATLIGHWRVDHTSPRVVLRDQDDALLIVPNASSQDAADACVRLEWKCRVSARE
jgi:hypothetical protein